MPLDLEIIKMTRIEMQNIILEQLTEKLQDTVDTRKRINIAFTQWFQSLIAPPPESMPEEGTEEQSE